MKQMAPSNKAGGAARRIVTFVCLGLALVAGLLAPGSPPALGQRLAPGAAVPRGAPTPLQPATAFNPERVRVHLRARHGFDKAQLQAASTDVARILMGWIADPREPMLIRRQAIKALKFYAGKETFAFIRSRLAEAPAVLKMLYLLSLQSHAKMRPAALERLAESYLDSGQVGVRHAAVSLIGRLERSQRLNLMLQERLAVEADAGLRKAIRQTLQKQ